jgi:GNAT superfamily N-acetyltransferase
MPVRLVPRSLSHPDAAALTAEMAAEVSALYGHFDALAGLGADAFEPPGGLFLVAYDESGALGCAGYRRIEPTLAQVQRVFVRPAARGRQLSRTLMHELEARAAEAGYTTLRLHTGVRQPVAVRLYEDLGYDPIDLFPPYEEDRFGLCYAKRIG